MVSDGSWQKALDANLGPSGFKADTGDQPAEAGRLLLVAAGDARGDGAGRLSAPERKEVCECSMVCVELLAEYDVLGAFWMTIKLTFVAAIGALVIGTVVAVMRVSPVGVLRAVGHRVRQPGPQHPADPDRVLLRARVLHHACSTGSGPQDSPDRRTELPLGVLGAGRLPRGVRREALRSGINTVPKGQAEAARAIGLTSVRRLTT